jgi:hypothetical protein
LPTAKPNSKKRDQEVDRLREELDAQIKMAARWVLHATESEAALNEANKHLEQSIEVLEAYEAMRSW